MTKYFRVQKGYNANDYLSIDESELQTAVRAQITGKVAIFKEGTISGNHIISITPDWTRMMGWNRGYQPTGEDYLEIGDREQRECKLMIEGVTERVKMELTVPEYKQIGAGS